MSQSNTEKPKYEIIMDDILARIQNNDFSYDTALCTEKQLSEQYHVSRITAKRAITDLEQRGILYRKRGVGSFVAQNALNNLSRPAPHATDSKMIPFLLPFDTAKGNIFHMIEIANTTLSSNGYFMSIYISDDSSAKEKSNIKFLLSQNISGLVYYPMRDKIYLNLINEFVYLGIPVVVIDKTTDCPYIHNVVSDNFEGGRLLTEHLIQLGHKNIGFFTTAPLEETSSVRNRFAGYLHQLQLSGIRPNMNYLVHYPKNIIEGDSQTGIDTSFQDAIRKMYNMGVTAIIAENDRVAQLIHMACAQMGINIPENLSLCGFDNIDVIQEMGITTIRQNFHDIGEKVSQILLECISTPSAPCQKITVPVELIVRGSTATPRE